MFSSLVAVSELDVKHLSLFPHLLHPEWIVEIAEKNNDSQQSKDGIGTTMLFWNSGLDKLFFYINVLHDVESVSANTDTNNGHDEIKDENSIGVTPILPIHLLRRRISLSNAKLMRFARDYETSVVRHIGASRIASGALGITGGIVTLVGLALAPFTLGGSLVMTGISVAASTVGSTLLIASVVGSVPTEIADMLWSQHYRKSFTDQTLSTIRSCDLLSGIVQESFVAFHNLESEASSEKSNRRKGKQRRAALAMNWIKNAFVSLRVSSDVMMSLPASIRYSVIDDVYKGAKSVMAALNSVSKSVDTSSNFFNIMSDGSKHSTLQLVATSSSKYLLHQPTALHFAATGVRIPWISTSSKSFLHPQWHQLIKPGSFAAVVLAHATSILSMATGILSVMSGISSLKGSGTLSDRIRKTVYHIDAHTTVLFDIYDILMLNDVDLMGSDMKTSEKGQDVDFRQRLESQHFRAGHAQILTSIEVHTCYAAYAQTDSPIRFELEILRSYGKSGNNKTIKPERCVSSVLSTSAHNDLEMNAWDVYDTTEVLGDCANALLPHPTINKVDRFRIRLLNGGSGAHCVDVINLIVNFETSNPQWSCSNTEGVPLQKPEHMWSDEGNSTQWITCHPAPDIRQVRVYPCLSDFAGTDSYVSFRMRNSKGDSCQSAYLDNNGNDLARGYDSVYRQDILKHCTELPVSEEGNKLEIAFTNFGFDTLCLSNVFIYTSEVSAVLPSNAKLSNESMVADSFTYHPLMMVLNEDSQDSREIETEQLMRNSETSTVFRCEIPPQYLLKFTTSPFLPCHPYKVDKTNGLSGIRPHLCPSSHSGSSTGFNYGFAMKICTSSSTCCETNYLDMLIYDELTAGSSDLYDQPGALGQCFGFPISSHLNLTFELINTNTDSICVRQIDLSTLQTNNLHPTVKCEFEYDQIWVKNSKTGRHPCKPVHFPVKRFDKNGHAGNGRSSFFNSSFSVGVSTTTSIMQIETYVCDRTFAGTDSAISVQICSSSSTTNGDECCKTPVLDKPGRDDFETGDFEVYSRLGDCSTHPIDIFGGGGSDSTTDGDMSSNSGAQKSVVNAFTLSIINEGVMDSVCFAKVNAKSSDGRSWHCFLPPTDSEFWVANGKLDLQCVPYLVASSSTTTTTAVS